MKLTASQQRAFWGAFAPAWAEYCRVSGQDAYDVEAQTDFRRSVLHTATGKRSLKDIGRGSDFEHVMAQCAVEAGDFERAGHFAVAAGRRIQERCEDCLRQICEIQGCDAGETAARRWEYVAGVIDQAYRRTAWEDIGEDQFAKVFMMLDTHRRRMLKAAGWIGGRERPDQPLAFERGRTFARSLSGRVVLTN